MSIWIIKEYCESVEERTEEHKEYTIVLAYADTEKQAKSWVKKNPPLKGYFDVYVRLEIEEIHNIKE